MRRPSSLTYEGETPLPIVIIYVTTNLRRVGSDFIKKCSYEKLFLYGCMMEVNARQRISRGLIYICHALHWKNTMVSVSSNNLHIKGIAIYLLIYGYRYLKFLGNRYKNFRISRNSIINVY